MLKRILIGMTACLSLCAAAVNHAATVQLAGGGDGVKVVLVGFGVTPINNSPDPTADKVKIALALPTPFTNATVVANCGFVFALGQPGNDSTIIATKTWHPTDTKQQANYNNLMDLAKSALIRQVEVAVLIDDQTCEVTDFGTY
jgi:hypothetical protein